MNKPFQNTGPRMKYWHHELLMIGFEMRILEKAPRTPENIKEMMKLSDRTLIVLSNIEIYLIQERSKIK